jgi:hypothetical protein
MPYPVVHVLFFVFCISAAVVYAAVKSFLHRELSLRDSIPILSLLLVGSLFALFPDIPAVSSFLINGNLKHAVIGSVPTHSFLFGSSAILLGTLIGYIAYREFGRAIYLGLYSEAAFLSHLLLDDATERGVYYFYPIYKGRISIFSLMDAGFMENGLFMFLTKSFVSIFFISLIIMMALFALNRLVLSLDITEKGTEKRKNS